MPGYNVMVEVLPLGGRMGNLISMPYVDLRLLNARVGVYLSYSSNSHLGGNSSNAFGLLPERLAVVSRHTCPSISDIVKRLNQVDMGEIPEVTDLSETSFYFPISQVLDNKVTRRAVGREHFILQGGPVISDAELITIETAKGEVWLQLIKITNPIYSNKWGLMICYQRHIKQGIYPEDILVEQGSSTNGALVSRLDGVIIVPQYTYHPRSIAVSTNSGAYTEEEVTSITERLRKVGDTITHKLRGLVRGEVLHRLEPVLIT